MNIDKAIEEKLVTKEEISHLPTKDEFYTKMDEVVGELKASREEQTLISHRVSDHEDRIEKIESISAYPQISPIFPLTFC